MGRTDSLNLIILQTPRVQIISFCCTTGLALRFKCPSVVLAVALRLSVDVRSQLEFESSVSIALLFVAPTTTPLLQQQQQWHLFLFLVWFRPSYFTKICMFRCSQTFDFKSNTAVWVLRVLFPEEIGRDYSQVPVDRPLGGSGCCTRRREDVFVPAFGTSVSGQVGVRLRSSGGKV